MSVFLKDESLRIDKNLYILEEEIKEQIKKTKDLIDEMTDEFKAASAQGDRSENAAFSDAKQNLTLYNTTLSKLTARLKAIQSKVCAEGYTPINLVTLYSTVRVKVLNNESEHIFKLFPDGISDIEKGIVSVDSRLGAAILKLEPGNTFVLEHKVTGEPIKYKIMEIY